MSRNELKVEMVEWSWVCREVLLVRREEIKGEVACRKQLSGGKYENNLS